MKVEWKTLRLAETTGEGYAETARPIDDLIDAAVHRELSTKKPVVVWIYDVEDDKTNSNLEGSIFNDEKTALALKQFHCLKGEIQTMPDSREVEKLKRMAPIFYFYDPSGGRLDTLTGRRATSRSGVTSRIEKLWDLAYEVSLKKYARDMARILDEMEKIDNKRARLLDQIDRAADNPRKLAGLKREEDELKKQEESVLAEEREVLAGVALKTDWTAAPEGESAKK